MTDNSDNTSFFQDLPNFFLDIPKTGGCSIALLGSTRSGKTVALHHIYNLYFAKHITVLYSGSPQHHLYKDMDCIQTDQWISRVPKEMASINKGTKNKYEFLNILDDIVTGVKFDPEMVKMLCVYRNSNVSTIITAQAANLLNSSGRTNINFILCFYLNSDEMIEKVVKYYLSSWFPAKTKMAQKIAYYRQMTADHHFFLVDNLNGKVYRSKINIEE